MARGVTLAQGTVFLLFLSIAPCPEKPSFGLSLPRDWRSLRVLPGGSRTPERLPARVPPPPHRQPLALKVGAPPVAAPA